MRTFRTNHKFALLKDGELVMIGTAKECGKFLGITSAGIGINASNGTAIRKHLVMLDTDYEKQKGWAIGTASYIYHLNKYGNVAVRKNPEEFIKDIPFKVTYKKYYMDTEKNIRKGKVQYWIVEKV